MSSQGGKWGLKISSFSTPQTYCSPGDGEPFPNFLCPLARLHIWGITSTQKPLWTSSAVDGALPLGSRQVWVQVPPSLPPRGSATSLRTQGKREGAGTVVSGSSLRSLVGLWTLLRVLQDPWPSLLLPSLYYALTPSLWVSPGFCLTTAGPILPCICPKPLPCPPAPPRKGTELGHAWRPGSSWVPGEGMHWASCSLSSHQGRGPWGILPGEGVLDHSEGNPKPHSHHVLCFVIPYPFPAVL